ncbi:MAG: hypothetical protein JOY82_03265 [Streptosporangiaceae bacterium]|nr:hypothetical protein [Streptosporangiaceae bacterium]MBV9853532.1 hypothetical protein [Streptosporangiaceae bacterium]
MKQYMKYQALLKLYPEDVTGPGTALGPTPRRMVLRATDSVSHRCQFFSALVNSDEGPIRQGDSEVVATLRIAGDDIGDYFKVGEHFEVWMGDEVGRGVITRRLFI